MDKHELISKLKDLAIELGKTPSCADFQSRYGGTRYAIPKLFGSYTQLLLAAGLDTYDQRRAPAKITNEIFQKNIETHLNHYEPRETPERTPWPKIAILGDLHEPFGHKGVKDAFIAFCKETQPEYIIQAGDSRDQYSNGKFPRSHNQFTPKQEEDTATKHLAEFWASIHEAVPEAKKVLLLGNHCLRPLKRVIESIPSLEHWAEAYMQQLMSFPHVETIMDPRQEYIIGDIAFIHGYRSKLGEHRDYMLMNVVCGHTHMGGVSFRQIQGQTLFEMNVGLAGDPESKGLSYTPQKAVLWTLGWGYIDQWGPRFIPYR